MTESALNQRLSPIVATTLFLLFGWLLLGLFILVFLYTPCCSPRSGRSWCVDASSALASVNPRRTISRHPRRYSRARTLMIGVLMASFMLSGTVPSLLYYGLYLLSPEWFAPATLILCAVMSSATGTSWGTVATLGVALSGWDRSLVSRPRSSREQPSLAQVSVTRCRPFG